MTKSPILNALLGLLYIVLVVSFLYNASALMGEKDNIFMPIAFLSLFVFSAASMSYIFLYQPLQLFLEGKQKEAVALFLKTIGFFAISALILVSLGSYLLNVLK